MRVIVCGGRTYADQAELDRALDALHAHYTFTTVVHGAAAGADTLAGEWALKRKIPVESFPADWRKYGRGAGPVRNKTMLETGVNLVIAFPGGRGTANMIKQAIKAGVQIVDFRDGV